MHTSTDPEPSPRQHNPLPKHTQLVALSLVIVVTFSTFILAPDARTVLGSSWSAPSAGRAAGCSYRIRTGDNLFRIGLRFGVSFDYLAMINGIANPHRIYAGTTLSVPCGGSAEPLLPQPCAPSESYVVNPGDNLFRIALNHGSTVSLIRDANNLWGRVLRPGTTLTIPCPGSVNYGGAAPPASSEQPVNEVTAAPTVAASSTPAQPVQAVTPQITPLPQPTAIPVNTPGPERGITPAFGTPITPALAPESIKSPTPVTVNTLVSMRENRFVPDTVQIPVGGRVTWVNDETDGTKHTVTCAQCPPTFTFDSGSAAIDTGKSFSVLFNVPGVFFYDSKLQPQMTGMVIVTP